MGYLDKTKEALTHASAAIPAALNAALFAGVLTAIAGPRPLVVAAVAGIAVGAGVVVRLAVRRVNPTRLDDVRIAR